MQHAAISDHKGFVQLSRDGLEETGPNEGVTKPIPSIHGGNPG
jgi:hypothetical protein